MNNNNMEANRDAPNTIEFEVCGNYALFSDPIFRVGGEKCSYTVPTYDALKGVVASIYFKPTFTWIIDKVRIMNRIECESKGILKRRYEVNQGDLSCNRYLKNVRYQVRAHFEWNYNHPELEQDRNLKKHAAIAHRALERGGRRDVYLGARECQAYVKPCIFGEGKGYYDNYGTMELNTMRHGYTYPDEGYDAKTRGYLTERYWLPEMQDGVIKFLRPENCPHQRRIRPMVQKVFGRPGAEVKPVDEEEI